MRNFLDRLVGVRPSHETVRQWVIEVGENYRQSKEKTRGSGIYCYDEQYLRIKGRRHYRLTIVDAVSGEVVNEQVVKDRTDENIKNFLVTSLSGKKVLVIVSDGDPDYDNILIEVQRELNLVEDILHQLCRAL